MVSGILMALDANSGKLMWQFNMGAPLGIGGPSIGNGMLLVPAGAPDEVGTNLGGWIVAFGLPSGAAAGQNATSPIGAAAGVFPAAAGTQPISEPVSGLPAAMSAGM